MNHITLNRPQDNHDGICGDLVTMAERELAAFFRAVTDSFGSEHAEVSAAAWLEELAATHNLPASIGEWRRLTVKASARLADHGGLCQGIPLALLKSTAEAGNHDTTV
jgi:hypothetical protein